jgi:protein gp37
MGKESKISWTDHTFNPWWGCTKVSEACDHCYAEPWAKRCGFKVFGPNAARRMMSDAYWREPIKWNKGAAHSLGPVRVFCGSMCDVFEDNPAVTRERQRLFLTIEDTSNLTWLLLTKRPENILRLIPSRWELSWPENVWTGTTLELQKHEKRITDLLCVPGKHFVSVEPMLSEITLKVGWLFKYRSLVSGARYSNKSAAGDCETLPGIDWVIAGSESGPGRRPSQIDDFRSLRDQCVSAGVPFHLKQMEIDGELVKSPLLDGKEWLEFPA